MGSVYQESCEERIYQRIPKASRQDIPEDLEDLVDFRITGEQRMSAHDHFGEDTTNRPHIDGC